MTIRRRTPADTVDAYGDAVQGEVTTETVGSLQQRARTEFDGAEVSETTWLLFLPDGTALDTSDLVTVAGLNYEVVGDPWAAREGSPDLWHVEATVKRVGQN